MKDIVVSVLLTIVILQNHEPIINAIKNIAGLFGVR